MKKNIKLFIYILSITLILLTGCQSSESVSSMKDFDEFIAVKYEDAGESGLASLTAISGENKEDIDKKVYYNSINFISDIEKSLYIDENKALFIKGINNEPVKLAEDVLYYYYYGENNNEVLLGIINDEDEEYFDVYIFNTDNGEKNKITSDIKHLEVNSDLSIMAYIDDEDTLYIKKIENDEKEISTSINKFFLSEDGKQICFSNENGIYIYSLEKEDKEKITSDTYIYSVDFKSDGSLIYMIPYEDSDFSGKLYMKKLEQESEKIASDVMNYEDTTNGTYYLDDDFELYFVNEEGREKISSDVVSFASSNDGNTILYIDEDDILYRVSDGLEKEKLISDLISWDYNGHRFVGLTNENDLYAIDNENDKNKVAEDVKEFIIHPYSNNVAFLTNDNEVKLYKDIELELRTVIEKSDAYNKVYFGESLLYERNLSISDIKGIWKIELDDESMPDDLRDVFVEITNNNISFYTMGYKLLTGKINIEAFSLTEGILNITEIEKNRDQELVDFANMIGEDIEDLENQFINSSLSVKIEGKSLILEDDSVIKESRKYLNDTLETQKTIITNLKESISILENLGYVEYGVMKQDGNLREEPGTESKNIDVVKKDTELFINGFDFSDDGKLWCEVYIEIYSEISGNYIDSLSGWISYDLIETY